MKALIIYDDVFCATNANAVLRRAAHRADVEVKWEISPWRLNMLKSQLTGDRALRDAADADLIIFAIKHLRRVHGWLMEWLRQWASCRKSLEAALAIIGDGSPGADTAAATHEISQFASQNGLSFIFNNHGETNAENGFHNLDTRQKKSAATSSIFTKAPSGTANRAWGIND